MCDKFFYADLESLDHAVLPCKTLFDSLSANCAASQQHGKIKGTNKVQNQREQVLF